MSRPDSPISSGELKNSDDTSGPELLVTYPLSEEASVPLLSMETKVAWMPVSTNVTTWS